MMLRGSLGVGLALQPASQGHMPSGEQECNIGTKTSSQGGKDPPCLGKSGRLPGGGGRGVWNDRQPPSTLLKLLASPFVRF